MANLREIDGHIASWRHWWQDLEHLDPTYNGHDRSSDIPPDDQFTYGVDQVAGGFQLLRGYAECRLRELGWEYYGAGGWGTLPLLGESADQRSERVRALALMTAPLDGAELANRAGTVTTLLTNILVGQLLNWIDRKLLAGSRCKRLRPKLGGNCMSS
jgi:hypothetical protein